MEGETTLMQFVKDVDIPEPRERKKGGRPPLGLTPDEKLKRNNEAKRRWLDKDNNRERHNELTRIYKKREEVKARRRELYQLKKNERKAGKV